MKHTPGPWIIARYNYDKALCTIETAERGKDIPTMGNHIADVLAAGIESSNACLIAAAPELLEALKDLVSLYKILCGSDPAFVQKARAAITRAEGGK